MHVKFGVYYPVSLLAIKMPIFFLLMATAQFVFIIRDIANFKIQILLPYWFAAGISARFSCLRTVPYCVLDFCSCVLIGTKYSNVHGLRKAKQSLGKLMMTISSYLLYGNPTLPKLLKSVVVGGYELRTGVINICYDICAMTGDARIL